MSPDPTVATGTTNVVIAGLGGQGVLKASDILADAVFNSGFDVKKSEIHGMSQRGGSVASDVRFGERVLSPMITEGEADFLVVLSEDQVELNAPVLRPDGVLLAPDLLPPDVVANRRVWNVALLGALSVHLTVEVPVWEDAIRRALPAKVHETNLRVFHQMREKAATA